MRTASRKSGKPKGPAVQITDQPDPSDPRSLDHPSHREQWLELARTLGRLDARKDFEAIHGKPPRGKPDDRRKTKAR